MDLDIGVVSEVEKKQKKKLLLDYLYDNLKNHNWWAYRYFFCEFLAFLNIIGKLIVPCNERSHLQVEKLSIYCTSYEGFLFWCSRHSLESFI